MWYVILVALHALASVLAFGVVTSLLTFHLMIIYRQQTTFEWLVEDSRKQKLAPPRMSFGERVRTQVECVCEPFTRRGRNPGAVSSTREEGAGRNAPAAATMKAFKVDVPASGRTAPPSEVQGPARV